MPSEQSQWCVLLPCSAEQRWALPQNCLAEIVMVGGGAAEPPRHIEWREREVPVLDLDPEARTPWLDQRGESGLVAVLLGLRDEGCDYWAVALRGPGLGIKDLAAEPAEDAPEAALPGSVGAFRLAGTVYQVPDLLELQRGLSEARLSA
jgi:hypothetical protein